MNGLGVYLIAAALMIVALWRGLRPHRTIKARHISNSIVINGDNSSPITHRSAPGNGEKPAPDRVAWGLAGIGIAVAVAQLVADLVKP